MTDRFLEHLQKELDAEPEYRGLKVVDVWDGDEERHVECLDEQERKVTVVMNEKGEVLFDYSGWRAK